MRLLTVLITLILCSCVQGPGEVKDNPNTTYIFEDRDAGVNCYSNGAIYGLSCVKVR